MINYLKTQLTPMTLFIIVLFVTWIALLIIAAIKNNNSLK